MDTEYLLRIWMVRHGQTTWNENGRCLGKTDLPLSFKGRQAAKRIANCIDISQCSAVVCSPYKRAIESARLLMGNSINTLIICEELREIDFGNWEGMLWKNIIEKRNSEWNAWKNDPFLSNPYDGESLSHAEARIKGLYLRLLWEHLGQTILLVSHGGILNIFLSFLFQLPLSVVWTFKLNPASFSEVVIHSDRPVLTILNYGPNISIDNMYIGNEQDSFSQLVNKYSMNSNSLAKVQYEYFK